MSWNKVCLPGILIVFVIHTNQRLIDVAALFFLKFVFAGADSEISACHLNEQGLLATD
jgi:hypothetical protein